MELNSFGYSTKSKETSPIGGDIISRTMTNPFMVSEAHGKSSLLFKCDMLFCYKNLLLFINQVLEILLYNFDIGHKINFMKFT